MKRILLFILTLVCLNMQALELEVFKLDSIVLINNDTSDTTMVTFHYDAEGKLKVTKHYRKISNAKRLVAITSFKYNSNGAEEKSYYMTNGKTEGFKPHRITIQTKDDSGRVVSRISGTNDNGTFLPFKKETFEYISEAKECKRHLAVLEQKEWQHYNTTCPVPSTLRERVLFSDYLKTIWDNDRLMSAEKTQLTGNGEKVCTTALAYDHLGNLIQEAFSYPDEDDEEYVESLKSYRYHLNIKADKIWGCNSDLYKSFYSRFHENPDYPLDRIISNSQEVFFYYS